jgi:hypothetical protein
VQAIGAKADTGAGEEAEPAAITMNIIRVDDAEHQRRVELARKRKAARLSR